MDALTPMKDAYNKVVDKRNDFDEVYAKNSTESERAKAFVKILLSRLGLKQRSERAKREGDNVAYTYAIANLGQAKKFIAWRNPDSTPELELGVEKLSKRILERGDATTSFAAMPIEDQQRVLTIMKNEPQTSFEAAVSSIVLGDW
jgi:hypothetical protein